MIVEKGDTGVSKKGTGKIEKTFTGDGRVTLTHTEYAVDIKISNDNTKGERRCTVHVRSDGDIEEALKNAVKIYKDGLTN